MKSTKLFILSLFAVALFSCDATKTASTTDARQTSGGRNTSGTERVVSSTHANKSLSENNRNMYKAIGMRPEQIALYEEQWKNANPDAGRGRSNQSNNDYERIELQDKIMGHVLDADQFKKYQEWVRTQESKKD